MNYFSNDWLHPHAAVNFSLRKHYVNVTWEEIVNGRPRSTKTPLEKAMEELEISPDEDQCAGTLTICNQPTAYLDAIMSVQWGLGASSGSSRTFHVY